MVTKREDGGAAFPETHVLSDGPDNPGWMGCSGMTLRDYFAAKAMAAVWQSLDNDLPHSVAISSCVVVAYKIADAMLAERAK